MARWNGRVVSPLLVFGFMSAGLGLAVGPASADQFLVTKLTDSFDGVCDVDCSLREAIAAANDRPGLDQVLPLAGVHLLTINGAGEDLCATGDLDVTDDLDLVGVGAGVTVIDASSLADDDRVLHVRSGVVAIREVTVQGGSAVGSYPLENGGGIYNGAVLTVRDSVIANNSADGEGGGIFTDDDTVLEVYDSTISDNAAPGGGGINSYDGSVTVVGCDVLRNHSTGIYSARGGHQPDGGDLFVIDSRIEDNTTTWRGGGVVVSLGSAVIVNTSIDHNSADESGGGVYVMGGWLYHLGGSISYNTASEEGGAIRAIDAWLEGLLLAGNQGYDGGAVYGDHGSTVQVESCAFVDNVATGVLGGGICTHGSVDVIGSTFVNNQATADIPGHRSSTGAALYVGYNYSSLLVDSTVTGNTASMVPIDVDGDLVIRSSTIVGNQSLHAAMGGLSAGENGSIEIAGSIVYGNLPLDCYLCGAQPLPVSLGYNIEGGTDCGFTSIGDQQSTDPMLGPLADNGGPTWTMALLPGSPAIDAGDPGGCCNGSGGLLSLDQRTYAREVDGDGNSSPIADIGAFELDGFPARIFRDGFETTDTAVWSLTAG
jgi:CSLREA domain-containing protein